MVATAGEQGGHADTMRPFESLNSVTKGTVRRQAGTIFKFVNQLIFKSCSLPYKLAPVALGEQVGSQTP